MEVDAAGDSVSGGKEGDKGGMYDTSAGVKQIEEEEEDDDDTNVHRCLQCTSYAMHDALYTIHRTPYSCTLYTIHHTPYSYTMTPSSHHNHTL
jgi:hypothetical protein